MNTIDDPTIPDDLDARLRAATDRLDVSPAPLRSVERRARQRRRRRHGLAAAGAAAVVLVGAVAVGAITGGRDGSDEVVTATDPGTPTAGRSVPQPLLVHDYEPDVSEVTETGLRVWATGSDDWEPVAGAVLADGRRFVLSYGRQGTSAQGLIELTNIDHQSAPAALHWPLDDDAPDGTSSDVAIVGTSGNEIILRRLTERTTVATNVETTPTSTGGGTKIEQSTRITAIDVDTGTERAVLTDDTAGFASAAGDVLVRNYRTDCTLDVSSLSGSTEPRTIDGGCPPGIEGLEGLAFDLAVSPDGRYVATVWDMIRRAGSSQVQLSITDLQTGTTSNTIDLTQQPSLLGMAWTGDRMVTLAVGDPAANGDVSTVKVDLGTASGAGD